MSGSGLGTIFGSQFPDDRELAAMAGCDSENARAVTCVIGATLAVVVIDTHGDGQAIQFLEMWQTADGRWRPGVSAAAEESGEIYLGDGRACAYRRVLDDSGQVTYEISLVPAQPRVPSIA